MGKLSDLDQVERKGWNTRYQSHQTNLEEKAECLGLFDVKIERQ